jgi:hypothetical protein
MREKKRSLSIFAKILKPVPRETLFVHTSKCSTWNVKIYKQCLKKYDVVVVGQGMCGM